MSPAPVFVRIPGSHHPGTRLRLVPGFRDPGSVLILGQVTQYGNPYLICITLCINPFCTGCLNAISVHFLKWTLNISVNFVVKFDWFKWNFLNFKLDTFTKPHPNFMAIGPAVTKQSANKCRSLCKLISNSMHVNLGQTNDGIAMKVRYHRKEWVQS